MMLKEDLKKLIKSMQQSAPIVANTKWLNYSNQEEKDYYEPLLKTLKYPYKPALIIALIKHLSTKFLFNTWIDLKSTNNEPIIKTFYDLLLNSDTFAFYLNHINKSSWSDCYNLKTRNAIINFIFNMPADKLKIKDSNIWEINKEEKSIRINLSGTDEELNEVKKLLSAAAYLHLKKCIPEYKDLEKNSEIDDYASIVQNEIITNSNEAIKVCNRKFQHIFSKEVKDRDKKCIICCLDNPILLEACHIKPYAQCINTIEKYDCENGITLCRNHHKLFDQGYFSFDNEWKVVISNKFKNEDADLLIKKFEPCFSKISSDKGLNKYIKYHLENILIR